MKIFLIKSVELSVPPLTALLLLPQKGIKDIIKVISHTLQ